MPKAPPKKPSKPKPEKKSVDVHNVDPALRGMLVPIASLTFDPENPREHSDDNVKAIMGSLTEFGQDQPLVVQREGMIVRKGNGRLAAMKKLGWTHAACLIVDEDRMRAIARAITDNRTSDLARYNFDTLGDVLAELGKSSRFDLDSLGWTTDQLAPLLNMSIRNAEKETEEGSELNKKKSPTISPPEAQQRLVYFSQKDFRIVQGAIVAMRNEKGDSEMTGSEALKVLALRYLKRRGVDVADLPE